MPDEPLPTTELLARAMEFHGAPIPAEMIKRARDGYYDDFKSSLGFPLTQLVKDLRAHGAEDLAQRVVKGEFDATKEESEAWARSEEGQATFREFIR